MEQRPGSLDGCYSSSFMPGNRIDNPLLRPYNTTGEAADGTESTGTFRDDKPDRLPRYWTRHENNTSWEAPDEKGTLVYFAPLSISDGFAPNTSGDFP